MNWYDMYSLYLLAWRSPKWNLYLRICTARNAKSAVNQLAYRVLTESPQVAIRVVWDWLRTCIAHVVSRSKVKNCSTECKSGCFASWKICLAHVNQSISHITNNLSSKFRNLTLGMNPHLFLRSILWHRKRRPIATWDFLQPAQASLCFLSWKCLKL